ncbi:hypothetical protein Goari_011648, partial [Gossypium aridum]|nr:hypothetical protein [Gossypium aridum]
MGHDFKGCLRLSLAEKNKIRDDPPYSAALKAESNLIWKEYMKFNALFKKKASQYSYTGSSESPLNYAKIAVDGNNMFWREECITRKRKPSEEEIRALCTEFKYDDGAKRLKHEEVADRSDVQTGKSTGRNENLKLECPWINESMGEGSRGLLCLAWKADISVNLRSFSKSHIDVILNEECVKEECRFTGFYGSRYVHKKNDSWSLLRNLGQQQSFPWLVSGDFNEIMFSFEK